MPMSRDELDLMRELRRLSECIPGFVLAFANDELDVEVEISFVHQLANMAEGLLRHADGRRGLVVEGEVTRFVIEAGVDASEQDGRALGVADALVSSLEAAPMSRERRGLPDRNSKAGTEKDA
jgi:hypothetical protein